MAGQVAILDDNFVVNQANGVSRYKAVVQGPNDHECAYGTAAGVGKFLGITQEDQDNGLTCNVRMLGNSYVSATGAIAAGASVAIGDANGNISDAAGLTTPVVIGQALTSATAAGDLILVSIRPSN